jgi:hypothetical protein
LENHIDDLLAIFKEIEQNKAEFGSTGTLNLPAHQK